MKNGIDNIGFPKKPDPNLQKSELIEDSQERMWGQLLDLKVKLEKENLEIQKSWSFPPESLGRAKEIMSGEGNFDGGSQNLREVAMWYGKNETEFIKQLEGKMILDIGSSKSTFAKEAKERVDCDIVSLDIKKEFLEDKDLAVVARGEALPFKDESFDEVFATFSLPFIAMNEVQVEKFFEESLRVTKSGGHINIIPITTIQNRYIESNPAKFNDPNIYVANKIQIKTIDVLQSIQESEIAEVVLGRNYVAMGQKIDKESLKKYPPTIAFIKKLKSNVKD